MIRCTAFAGVFLLLGVTGAAAQSCGRSYEVQRGDSLSIIAARYYKNAFRWTEVYEANRRAIGEDPDTILAGDRLDLICIDGLPEGLVVDTVVSIEPTAKPEQFGVSAKVLQPVVPVDVDAKETVLVSAAPDPVPEPTQNAKLPEPIKIVTGDGMAPFSDQKLPGGGLIAEIMSNAFEAVSPPQGFETFRINDRASHLMPLLTENLMDVSYPWLDPKCSVNSVDDFCAQFTVSDPMLELLVLLFVDRDKPIPFSSDADLHGRTLCRPAGAMVHMLDAKGRNWVREGKIDLIRAVTSQNCFELLVSGKVDAVVMNEFTGRTTVSAMALEGRVLALQNTPLSTENMVAIVSKTNPQANFLIEQINTGLSDIKSSGLFQSILDRHLTDVWAGL